MILLIGPPGSGKSTQSNFLREKHGYSVISTEDLIRDNKQAFHKREASLVDNIDPRNDSALNQLVEDKLKSVDLAKGTVLDGYPATKEHCDYLLGLTKKLNLAPATILWLDVPDAVVLKRLEKRKAIGDTQANIEQRLKDFHREMDMIHVYFPNAVIQKVDATRKPAAVSKSIEALLSKP